MRMRWSKSLFHLNKGLLCESKFFLYAFSSTRLSLTHPWSMTVTRSLATSASFLGSAKSLVACTSIGLACGGRRRSEHKEMHLENMHFCRFLLILPMTNVMYVSDLCHHCGELGKAGSVTGVAGPALPHDSVQLLRAIWRLF